MRLHHFNGLGALVCNSTQPGKCAPRENNYDLSNRCLKYLIKAISTYSQQVEGIAYYQLEAPRGKLSGVKSGYWGELRPPGFGAALDPGGSNPGETQGSRLRCWIICKSGNDARALRPTSGTRDARPRLPAARGDADVKDARLAARLPHYSYQMIRLALA